MHLRLRFTCLDNNTFVQTPIGLVDWHHKDVPLVYERAVCRSSIAIDFRSFKSWLRIETSSMLTEHSSD